MKQPVTNNCHRCSKDAVTTVDGKNVCYDCCVIMLNRLYPLPNAGEIVLPSLSRRLQ